MKPPRSHEPPKQCPVCQVAMQTDETKLHVVHQCLRCGVVIQIAKLAK
jgi:hypothetical protein